MALAEAIPHLNKGLELVTRAAGLRGARPWAPRPRRSRAGQAQEVWDSLHPGAGIGKPLRRTDALLPILGGLFIHVLARGRVAESLRWVARMQEAAETFD